MEGGHVHDPHQNNDGPEKNFFFFKKHFEHGESNNLSNKNIQSFYFTNALVPDLYISGTPTKIRYITEKRVLMWDVKKIYTN